MPRIRSLFAEQWTDDDFVSLTDGARLLTLSVRNFADDNGVFVWNLPKLKMLCFPADNRDMAALLDELLTHSIVRQFEAGGKLYGQIRNFVKYQRPKKPTFHHPVPSSTPGYEINAADDRPSTELTIVKGGASTEPKPLQAPPNSSKRGTGPAEVGKEVIDPEPVSSVGAITSYTEDAEPGECARENSVNGSAADPPQARQGQSNGGSPLAPDGHRRPPNARNEERSQAERAKPPGWETKHALDIPEALGSKRSTA